MDKEAQIEMKSELKNGHELEANCTLSTQTISRWMRGFQSDSSATAIEGLGWQKQGRRKHLNLGVTTLQGHYSMKAKGGSETKKVILRHNYKISGDILGAFSPNAPGSASLARNMKLQELVEEQGN